MNHTEQDMQNKKKAGKGNGNSVIDNHETTGKHPSSFSNNKEESTSHKKN